MAKSGPDNKRTQHQESRRAYVAAGQDESTYGHRSEPHPFQPAVRNLAAIWAALAIGIARAIDARARYWVVMLDVWNESGAGVYRDGSVRSTP
jgi:hypothetical protein